MPKLMGHRCGQAGGLVGKTGEPDRRMQMEMAV